MRSRFPSRALLCLLLCVAMLPLAGCERMLKRQYYALSPHMELTYEDRTDSVEITNYAMLLKYLQEWVRAGVTEGTMRFSNFDGNIDKAVDEACGELLYNDAYGRFVEAVLVPVTTMDIKGKLVTFKIRYRRNRPQAEIDALLPVSGSGLRTELLKALRDYTAYSAMELLYPVRDELDSAALIEELYWQQPLYALGFPQTAGVLYKGDKSPTSILELRMTYNTSQQVLKNQQKLVEQRLLELAAQTDVTLSPPDLALQLHDLLCGYVEYDFDRASEDSLRGPDRAARPYSMTGAMLDRKAVSEGYALAFKALCDTLRINCQIVQGRLDGENHIWNVIELFGNWYWVDTAADDWDELPRHERFLGTDTVWLENHYTWDAERYPRCESDPALLNAPGSSEPAPSSLEPTASDAPGTSPESA